MSREIRITIDDDEVFERLKRRKRDLDLSWEEALRRGLEERGPAHPPRPPSGSPGGDPDGRARRRGPDRDGRERRRTGGPFDPEFGDRLERRIRESVAESLGAVEGAMEAIGDPIGDGLEDEIGRLEEAEDAVLSFDWLEADGGARVPLRVTMETTPAGLDVEVVAVRRGKGTAGMNRFADDDRRAVTERLVAGETATLSLQDGAERYEVVPVLSWTRDADGTPVVTDVEIDDVRFE